MVSRVTRLILTSRSARKRKLPFDQRVAQNENSSTIKLGVSVAGSRLYARTHENADGINVLSGPPVETNDFCSWRCFVPVFDGTTRTSVSSGDLLIGVKTNRVNIVSIFATNGPNIFIIIQQKSSSISSITSMLRHGVVDAKARFVNHLHGVNPSSRAYSYLYNFTVLRNGFIDKLSAPSTTRRPHHIFTRHLSFLSFSVFGTENS